MASGLKRTLSFSLILLVAATMSACSSGGKLTADYDHDAQFSTYKTWNFIEDAGPDHSGYESLFSQYMVTAITKEMNQRGYVQSDNPDLLVNFNVYVQEKTKVRQTSSPYDSYYGYRGGYYDPWGGYGMGMGTQTTVSQYDEGTFNIDLIDARQKRLVWEAVGVGKITDKLKANLEQAVIEGVPEFFELYPFTAGSDVPIKAK